VELKDYLKWKIIFTQWQMDICKKRANDSTIIDLKDVGPSNDGRTPQPTGNKASKNDLCCESSSIALEYMLGGGRSWPTRRKHRPSGKKREGGRKGNT
jgi:hypothetical protein